MQVKKRQLVFSLFLLMLANKSFAVSMQEPPLNNAWQFQIAPYLWAINMSGRVQIGPAAAHISENFSDILHQFQGGGMVYLDAQKNNFGLYANALYAVLEQQDSKGPVTAKLKNNFGVFSAGVSYIVYQKNFTHGSDASHFLIAPYVGARYTLNNTRLTVPFISFAKSSDYHWTDPTIGARVRYDFNKKWQVLVAGDVGGTNLSSDKSYNVQGYVGYSPVSLKTTTFYAGYRMLYQHYVTGSGLNKYDWSMRLFGPVLGVSFGF